MKYSEIIARNLKKAGWSLGYVSALDREARTNWITGRGPDRVRWYGYQSMRHIRRTASLCKESLICATNLQNNKRNHNANHAARSNESSETENAARANFW